MSTRRLLSLVAVMALVSAGAMAQQENSPTDPSAPSGCTGFPGDAASCAGTDPGLPNTTIPEEPAAPDLNTQSGDQEPLPTPDSNSQQDIPNGASPDNPATNPDAGGNTN
jgi:hypothetical protein